MSGDIYDEAAYRQFADKLKKALECPTIRKVKLGDLRGHRRVFLLGFAGSTVVAVLNLMQDLGDVSHHTNITNNYAVLTPLKMPTCSVTGGWPRTSGNRAV